MTAQQTVTLELDDIQAAVLSVRVHFQTLVQQPGRVLCQIRGSPFSDEPIVIQVTEKPPAIQPLALAAESVWKHMWWS
jgi:hypothetical protein